MTIVKLAQMFKELASELQDTYDGIICANYNKDCDGCPLMALQDKWLNWNGQCIGELLLQED